MVRGVISWITGVSRAKVYDLLKDQQVIVQINTK